MLNEMNAIATIGVKNIEAARDFYEKKLGLTPVSGPMPEEVQHYKCGNSVIEVYHSEFGGTNKATTLSFDVGDRIVDEVKTLKDKGVTFEHYNFPDSKLEGDIHVMGNIRAAWFKDPDGNIICLANQH